MAFELSLPEEEERVWESNLYAEEKIFLFWLLKNGYLDACYHTPEEVAEVIKACGLQDGDDLQKVIASLFRQGWVKRIGNDNDLITFRGFGQ